MFELRTHGGGSRVAIKAGTLRQLPLRNAAHRGQIQWIRYFISDALSLAQVLVDVEAICKSANTGGSTGAYVDETARR